MGKNYSTGCSFKVLNLGSAVTFAEKYEVEIDRWATKCSILTLKTGVCVLSAVNSKCWFPLIMTMIIPKSAPSILVAYNLDRTLIDNAPTNNLFCVLDLLNQLPSV